LDAAFLKQRQGGRIVSVAAIIAVAANTEGRREIIGLGAGAAGHHVRSPQKIIHMQTRQGR